MAPGIDWKKKIQERQEERVRNAQAGFILDT